MAFFAQKNEEKKSADTKAVALKKEKKVTPTALNSKNAEFADVLLRPMVTEKVHMISAYGQYAFFADLRATKTHIKKAIQQIYGVHVVGISTLRVKPKKRIRGKETGYTRRMKKVMVSLRKGESIALFEGV